MRSGRAGRTVAVMLPALRLPLATLAVLLVTAPAAQAAKGLSVPVPAEGQVAVAVAGGVKSVKVKSAPKGVTVAGGVKQGRLAVAVVRPRGAAASGKVVLTLRGKAKQVKPFPAALNGGKATGCADLGTLLGKRLKGSADVKALGARGGREAVRQAGAARRGPGAVAARAGARRHAGRVEAGQPGLRPRRAAAGRRARGRPGDPAADAHAGVEQAPVRQQPRRRRRRPDGLPRPGLPEPGRHQREQRGAGLRRVRPGAPASAWARTAARRSPPSTTAAGRSRPSRST